MAESSQELRLVEAKKSRSVSFHSSDEIFVIPNTRKELSRKEKSKVWCNDHDFQLCNDNCRKAMNQLRKSGRADAISIRGLEMFDPTIGFTRATNSFEAVSAVLGEQDFQRSTGACDPKEIRNAYRGCVTRSMRGALENAHVDQMAVKDYLASTTQELEDGYSQQREEPRKSPKPSLSGFLQLVGSLRIPRHGSKQIVPVQRHTTSST
jgi:hypothetical protein